MSHNLPLDRTIDVTLRTDAEWEATLSITLPDEGTLRGEVRAPMVDCTARRGPYPM